MELTVDSRKNCYIFGVSEMEKIQEEVCASAILSIGTYSISIKSGELSYSIPPDIRGEPVLL